MIKALFIFGTRPEAIKLCPVAGALRDDPRFRVSVCVTAQHRALLDQVLGEVFDVRPDHDLNVMTPGQTLFQSTARIIAALEPVLDAEQPDVVLVQGDTTTTFCGALSAFYKRIPVAHVEAGLRTGDIYQPFPEEMNRLLAGRLAAVHFAATDRAAANLRAEGVPKSTIFVTGNTGIDAVLRVARALESGALPRPEWPQLDPSKKLIVVTSHRRESFGPGMENTCRAIAALAARPDTQIVFPVHPNPNVGAAVSRHLAHVPNVVLCEPLGYVPFVDLMRRAYLLITDSGGVQEEGPSLGKPILVLRDKTERPEAVDAGTVILVGTDEARIVANATRLLDDAVLYSTMARAHNPYGDGRASQRIAGILPEALQALAGRT